MYFSCCVTRIEFVIRVWRIYLFQETAWDDQCANSVRRRSIA
jgi:hypothetical protein